MGTIQSFIQIWLQSRVTLPVSAILLAASIAACSHFQHAHHTILMRGSVLAVNEGTATLCIGSREGAQVGQKLRAYEYVRSPGAPRNVGFVRREVGAVQIIEIVDEHFARATVVSGVVKENAIVELD